VKDKDVTYLFWDIGTIAKWDTNGVTALSNDNGVTFISNIDTSRASMNPLDNSSAHDFNPVPMAWEFDLESLTVVNGLGVQFIQISPSNRNYQQTLNSNHVGKHIKQVYDGTKLHLYVDGTEMGNQQSVTYDGMMRVGFALYGVGSSITVRNIKAYLI
ncbi:MAG: hypothetical protein IJJ47_04340, partial [Methanosphaera sp.]|nr:hypothetical protein [Methanosphaera sp.]